MAHSRRRPLSAASALEAFSSFIQSHGSTPLSPEEEKELFVLDLSARHQCKTLGVTPPELGRGSRTPGMKLNYERESAYKYPAALSGDPRIPKGEIEHYGICMCPDQDWLLWLSSALSLAERDESTGSSKKRPDRLADIQRLIDVVRRKIQEAVDHAVFSWNTYGEPEILPRCRQVDIGNECNLSETTTSRCFNDRDAGELHDQLLAFWEKLGDRNWILEQADTKRERLGR